ncbi:MAG: MFS transporter [Nitrososphaerales archaeon]
MKKGLIKFLEKVFPSSLHWFTSHKISTNSIGEPLDKANLRGFHYKILAITSLIYGFTGMNVMLISVALKSISIEWNLAPVTAGMLASSFYVGMVFGALLSGRICDIIGRCKALALLIFISSIFMGLSSIAWDVWSMAALRFLSGFGAGGTLPLPAVYIAEYSPIRYRGTFLGLVESSWVYGVLIGLFYGYLVVPTHGWRLGFYVAFLVIILVPIVIKFLPESIRYLQSKGRSNEVLDILKKLDFDIPKKMLEFKEEKFGWRDILSILFSTYYIRRTILLWVLWGALVYTYHGIFIWLPTIYSEPPFNLKIVKSLEFVLIVTLFQIPGYYSATFLLDKIGRKKVLAIYLISAGISSYLLGLSMQIEQILIWSSLISFFNLGAWAGLYAYTPELYPTRFRGTGTGIAASVGRIMGVFAPTLTPFLLNTFGLYSTFIVFAFIHILAGFMVIILGIETKKKKLEEISL